MRFLPCPVPGCGELRDDCPNHRRPAWAGRTGTTRREALGVSDSAWEHLRRAALRRDRHRCLRCGSKATTVDHLIPVAWRRPPAPYRAHLAQLGSLCGDCHSVKTSREAVMGRRGRPTDSDIAAHVKWWLAQCSPMEVARAH